ncbi:Thioredoxin family protein [Tritrichomonas foetus]|uniref:protein disulfide-isomerase n=1 Tax=Tritrichomonas foetus TaxID=1144522 RepID=A0A1J4KUL8_9EUKA|nr:Thioredoxin family protein [Tritrichomonas foetus]|eukprot:OHT14834.1 Thioredoxin family protein [Tritrichomonas foetus]
MICLLLISIIYYKYVEFNSDSFNKYIGGEDPILVKFYSHRCLHCKETQKYFAEAAEYFPEIYFAGIDCLDHVDVCKQQEINTYPSFKFYKPYSKIGVDYFGGTSVSEIVKFLSSYSFQARKIPHTILNLTSYNFERFINNNSCAFTIFYTPQIPSNDIRYQQMNEVAYAFYYEHNVSVGSIDCKMFNEICMKYSIHETPVIKLFKGNKVIPYFQEKSISKFVDFINHECGTNRRKDGLLSDNAGVLPEMDPFVDDFLNKGTEKQKEVINRIKVMNGTQLYVNVMERISSKGFDILKDDMQMMKKVLDGRNVSAKSLNNIKLKYNIMKQFVNHKPKPNNEDL